jgi:TolA-binding protein
LSDTPYLPFSYDEENNPVEKEVRQLSQDRTAPSRSLNERLEELEKKLSTVQGLMARLVEENRKIREDLKFYEVMLLEEYHMLIQLLEREKWPLKIQSTSF